MFVDAVRTLRSMSRGIRRGDLFPSSSRVPRADAPGGSSVEDHGDFVLVRHRTPVAGLKAPFTVLQISDVHVRHPTRPFEKLCNALTALRADVVALTGDIVAREYQLSALHHFFAHVPRGKHATVAILGNWERWAGFDAERFAYLLEPHQIPLLVDASMKVGPLTIVGTDDSTSGQPDLDRAFDGVSGPTVVLSHSPALFPQIAARGPALVLSGHSHGGQVRLPGLGALWVPRGTDRYIAGFYAQDSTHLYVSSGLGWSMAPLRLGVPPEVALHELVPGDPR